MPAALDKPPDGFGLTANEVTALAERQEKVRETRRERGRGLERRVFTKGSDRWQVSYYVKQREGAQRVDKETAQVLVNDAQRRVTEAWTDFQVAWTMARGYEGAFGRKAGALYVWIPLSLLFFLPFFDRRRPFRILHLDLLMLLGFGISLAFFSRGNIDASVPLAYPFLVYVLVRMLWVARQRGKEDGRKVREPLKLLVPLGWLAVALVFLVGFRVGLNVTNSNVIDVGYSGVIGADIISDGEKLYDGFPEDNQRGDTYGPLTYYAYVPFEQIWPWEGSWDSLPAAHGAAVVFDLLTILGLWLLGRRIRGPSLGLVLAYAWAAFPFTLYVSNANANDSLVALMVVCVLLVAGSNWLRGGLTALGAMTKFAPLGLAPMLATYDHARERATLRPKVLAPFLIGFAAVAALLLIPFYGDLGAVYDRTLGFQGERGSPFSIWGFYDLGTPQTVMKAAAALLCVVIAFVPRRRDVISLAALGAAAIVALQLGVTHWFYLYIVWFFPLVLVALLGPFGDPRAKTLEPAQPAQPAPPVAVAAPKSDNPIHA